MYTLYYIFNELNCRFKDNIEIENKGTNGTLTLAAVTLADAGVYKCTAETTAGVSQSDEASLTIKGSIFNIRKNM